MLSPTQFNITTLHTYHQNGLLKRQKHSTFNLYIWNYSETVQFNKRWDEITSACRGLITDDKGNIIARSFNKFHNYEEQRLKSAFNVRIFDKADGSLGILFFYQDEWILASRGSFASEQSIKGKSMIPDSLLPTLDPTISYVFEIIYPENKIVVDYGSKESILFLAAFKPDGTEIFIHDEMKDLGIDIVQEFTDEFPETVMFEEMQARNIPNKEGYVVLLSDGSRIKIKFPKYKELHKVLSDLSVKTVFESIKSGTSLDKLCETTPDEFHPWLQNLYEQIKQDLERLNKEVVKKFESIYNSSSSSSSEKEEEGMSRKDFAMAINTKMEPKYKTIMFRLLDKKPIQDLLYGLIDITKYVEPQ
jgi:hypothetical protein